MKENETNYNVQVHWLQFPDDLGCIVFKLIYVICLLLIVSEDLVQILHVVKFS